MKVCEGQLKISHQVPGELANPTHKMRAKELLFLSGQRSDCCLWLRDEEASVPAS